MESGDIEFKRAALGPLQTNSYVLWRKGRKKAVLIDPAGEGICNVVKDLGLEVEVVLNTHGHFDHILGDNIFKAPVYIHSLDRELLFSAKKNLSLGFGRPVEMPRDLDVRCLPEGDYKFADIVFEVLHTPGHSNGSVCFITDNLLITGDTLFKDGIGRTDLLGGNYEELVKSLSRIMRIERDLRVLPGHGPDIKLRREKIKNEFLASIY